MDALMDGQKVAYVGDGDDDLAVGDEGKVLSAGATGSHVRWVTGARAGDITLTHNFDLVVNRQAVGSYDNSLDTGSLVATAVRQTYDRQGPRAVVAALRDEGHLATMAGLADEAIQHLASTIRRDPSMREVLAHLDDEEGSDLVDLTAKALLKDAFGSF